MNFLTVPGRSAIILAVLCIGMVMCAGCVSDYVVRKNVVVFRMNESGAQQSAVSFLIENPGYDAYFSRPRAGRTCEGGLLLINSYSTISARDSGTARDYEYLHWFRIDRISADGSIAWEKISPANRSYPRISSIRECPDRFVFTYDEGETITLDRAGHPGTALSPATCPEEIYPEAEDAEPYPTGDATPVPVPNNSSSSLHAFPSSYVYLTDMSTHDWNGFEKMVWDLVSFTGISDVRDEGFTLDAKIFNRTGGLQGSSVLRWEPANATERIGNCEYTIRSFPTVYPAGNGGYFVVADLRCYG